MDTGLRNVFFLSLLLMPMVGYSDVRLDYPFEMGYFLGHVSTEIQEEAIARLKREFNISDGEWEKRFSFIKEIESKIRSRLSLKRDSYIRDGDLRPETVTLVEQMLRDVGIEPSAVNIQQSWIRGDGAIAGNLANGIYINQEKFDILPYQLKEAVIAHEIGHLANAHTYIWVHFENRLIQLLSKEKRKSIKTQYNELLQSPERIREIIPNAPEDFYIDAVSDIKRIQDYQLSEEIDSVVFWLRKTKLRNMIAALSMTEEQKRAIDYFQTTAHEFIADQYLASHDPAILESIKKLREELPFIDFPASATDFEVRSGYPTNDESKESFNKNLLIKQKYLVFLARLYDDFAPINTIELTGRYISQRDAVTDDKKEIIIQEPSLLEPHDVQPGVQEIVSGEKTSILAWQPFRVGMSIAALGTFCTALLTSFDTANNTIIRIKRRKSERCVPFAQISLHDEIN